MFWMIFTVNTRKRGK